MRSRSILGLGWPSSANDNFEWPLLVHWNCLFVSNQGAFNVSRVRHQSALMLECSEWDWPAGWRASVRRAPPPTLGSCTSAERTDTHGSCRSPAQDHALLRAAAPAHVHRPHRLWSNNTRCWPLYFRNDWLTDYLFASQKPCIQKWGRLDSLVAKADSVVTSSSSSCHAVE